MKERKREEKRDTNSGIREKEETKKWFNDLTAVTIF